MIKYISILTVISLIVAGCSSDKGPKYSEEELAQIPQPQRTNLPRPSGGFVLSVGTDTITSEEIIAPVRDQLVPIARESSFEQFAQKAAPVVSQVLINKVSDLLLYQKAKNEAPDDIDDRLEKVVESEIRKFVLGFEGDYAKAEAFLKEHYGMDWQQFRQYQRRMILSSSYLHEMLPEEQPVTYSQMLDYYNTHRELFHKEVTITIQLIDIDVTKLKTDDPNEDRHQVAMTLAEELLARLNNGEDFGELAKQYSNGYRARFAGVWNPVRPQSLAEPYNVLADAAENMQIGQVTGPIVTTDHIFIMKLLDKQQEVSIPFEQVQKQIEQQIIMERKRENFNRAMNKLMEEAAITGADEFVRFCLEQIYRQANS